MQACINRKVKFREGFRPFAPAILSEHLHEYFDWPSSQASPYMSLVAPVRLEKRVAPERASAGARGVEKLGIVRSTVPAVTHVDHSARIQTVDRDSGGLFRKLLEAFRDRTGCPLLVNTSFNLGWEPIVASPRDAYEAFMSSDLDALCMGPFLLQKREQPSALASGSRLGPVDRVLGLLASPCCGSELQWAAPGLVCDGCGHGFPIEGGIPQLFWPHGSLGEDGDVTERVRSFYEETPFPNYDEHESVRSLVEKSRAGGYAELLSHSIPFNSTVLEVGCGTGQLSNFLGIACRTVVGTDICLNSLALGEHFRAEHGLERVTFAQMNLFRPAIRRESIDVLICNGVLHHTSDPLGGLRCLVPLVRPGGYIVVGLYHRWGRLMTDVRRAIFRMTGGRARWIDSHLRNSPMSDEKKKAWFADQYLHPHESKHTVGAVLEWFDETGLGVVRGIPSLTLDNAPATPDDLFREEPVGSRFDRFVAQTGQIATGSREGGFFVMVGRKPESGARSPGS